METEVLQVQWGKGAEVRGRAEVGGDLSTEGDYGQMSLGKKAENWERHQGGTNALICLL
jgi:hypothetical protein